jgi:hypothetical protein
MKVSINHSITVCADIDEVQAFIKAWPCCSFEAQAISVTFDHDYNLTDLSSDIDGAESLAFVEDCANFAKKEIALKQLKELDANGWCNALDEIHDRELTDSEALQLVNEAISFILATS